MGWFDRLREAAYTSPDGETRIVFDYENVSVNIDKRTAAFNFPDVAGTYIQDLGHTGRRYPLRVFFWGDDYDLQSDEFESVLLQVGVGRLEHPIYGSIDVVPFGTITRRDDLKTAGNQAVFDVVFWETIGVVYPDAQSAPGSDVAGSVDAHTAASSSEFASVVVVDTAIEKVSLKNDYISLLDDVKGGLQVVADVQDDVRKQFNTINNSINQGIDVLINDPLTLAFQTVQLIQSPALALTAVTDRLNAYRDLFDSITGGNGANVGTSTDSRSVNKFRTSDLYAMGCVSGSILSTVNNQFSRKSDAIDAADKVLLLFDDLVKWRDDNFTALNQNDIGNAYSVLQSAVALTAGFLVEISFTLRAERRRTLDRSRTIVDLVAELYGVVDSELDFFISTNNLSGSEILELPRGRTIVYYV